MRRDSPDEPESLDEDDELETPQGGGYSIRVASRMTGLSVDTLRMWERRYNFPSPVRNAAGNRIYAESEVDRLASVGRAMKLGYRAGEAIRLTEPELKKLLAEQPLVRIGNALPRDGDIGRLMTLLKSHDIDRLRRELRRIAGIVGARRFVVEIVAPLLEAIGEAWSQGVLGVHQEHLATEVLSSQLRALLQQQEGTVGPTLLFGTLPREQHAIGAAMAALMASTAGACVELLGADSPTNEIVNAAKCLQVEAIGLSVSIAASRAAALSHLQWLAEHLPTNVSMWLGGNGAIGLDGLPSRVRVMRQWQDLDDAIRGLAREQ